MQPSSDIAIFIALFAVTNPFTTVPLLLAAADARERLDLRKTAVSAALMSGVILLVSLFLGELILELFSIEIDAFRLAGAAVIAATAWAMVSGRGSAALVGDEGSPVLVPLAIPSLAGPGAIAVVIALGHEAPGLAVEGMDVVVILLVTAVNMVVLLGARQVERFLGPEGMKVFSRLFGLLLLSIAFSSVLESLADYFPGWLAS